MSSDPETPDEAAHRLEPVIRRSPPPGLVAVLAAALLWATIGPWSVGAFRSGMTAWDVAFWRAVLTTVVLVSWAALRRPEVLRLRSPRELWLLAGYSCVAVGLFFPAFQMALDQTSVAVAVALLYTAPVWVAIGASVLLGERIGRVRALCLVAVVAGVWGTALGARGVDVGVTGAGVAWGLVAALAYSSYYLFGRRFVPVLGAFRVLVWSFVFGTPVLLIALVVVGHPPALGVPVMAWAPLLGLVLVGTVAANGIYYWGIRRAEAAPAAVVASVEPVAAALLALVLFGQHLAPIGWIGVLVVALGVAGAGAARGKITPAPPPAEADL